MLALRDSTEPSNDSSVYTISSPALELGKSLSVPSDSGASKVVAHRMWYLHVGPLVVTIVVSLSSSGISRTQVISQLSAGSSSPIFTTSGVSFEDIKPIDGRYGYVMISPYFEFPYSEFVPLKDLPRCTLGYHRDCNSCLDLFERYVPNKLPCTCPIPQINFLSVLTCHNPKSWIWATWVSIRLAPVACYEKLFLPDFLSLEFYRPEPGFRFAIARASHVSFQRFCATTMPYLWSTSA